MASGMAMCADCGLGTPIRGWTLPCFWKWVWCDTPAGGEWKCICKACRREIWRDCTKLEPHDHFEVTEFYDAVAKRLQATVPAPSRKDEDLQPTTQSQRGCKRPSPSNSSDEDVDVAMG